MVHVTVVVRKDTKAKIVTKKKKNEKAEKSREEKGNLPYIMEHKGLWC